jgi:predicted acylesterase/phospholipase RssA
MESTFEVLTLGPGGVKGFLELGILYRVEKKGILANVKEYIGVSVGAIICFFLNIGFTVKEIIYIAIENDMIINFDINNPNIFMLLNSVRNHFGLFSMEIIEKILVDAVISKYGYIPTMRQLYDITKKKLTIVNYVLSDMKTEYVDYKLQPDVLCIEPIIKSISIPLIFWMSRYQDKVYIDGAFGDPYPILLRDDGINKILGIYIKTDTENNDKKYNNPLLYLHDIFHCMFHIATERNLLEASKNCYNIAVESIATDPIGFSLGIEDKARMVSSGIQQAKKYFD